MQSDSKRVLQSEPVYPSLTPPSHLPLFSVYLLSPQQDSFLSQNFPLSLLPSLLSLHNFSSRIITILNSFFLPQTTRLFLHIYLNTSHSLYFYSSLSSPSPLRPYYTLPPPSPLSPPQTPLTPIPKPLPWPWLVKTVAEVVCVCLWKTDNIFPRLEGGEMLGWVGGLTSLQTVPTNWLLHFKSFVFWHHMKDLLLGGKIFSYIIMVFALSKRRSSLWGRLLLLPDLVFGCS